MSDLTIFYDGECPLCVREMNHLSERDIHKRLLLVDIQQDDFAQAYPHIDPKAASTILHGLNDQGELILGLDVTHRAWSLVGKGYWTAPLRWPVIRWFADKAYLYFARNRYKISGLFTGQERCSDGKCKID